MAERVMTERVGEWPFTFPPHTVLNDLKVSDIYVLIRRAVADGTLTAQSTARTYAPGTAADMIRAGLDDKRTLIGG